MTFVPHTEAERAAMLKAIGVDRLEALFDVVPQSVRFPALKLLEPISQLELEQEMRRLAEKNLDVSRRVSFMGAGAYDHYRPATVDNVLLRGEFYTSYTPYQPELSQGMLQAMFEYQTMVCQLTGMDVCNASHYDGATSLAEAVLLALGAVPGKRKRIVMSAGVHPNYRDVARTYLAGTGATIVEFAETQVQSGLRQAIGDDVAAVVVASPNFFGEIETLAPFASAARDAGALLVVVTDPIFLGLFAPPSESGADIVVADGQSLGLPPSYGGPSLGIITIRSVLLRRMPGRLVGQTTDTSGRRGYVLTLGTREQHIRRARATSNICTNAALSALAASVYLATMGRQGLKRVAELCFHKSHYAAARAAEIDGIAVNPQAPGKPFFKEFVLRLPRPAAEVNRVLLDKFEIIGGVDLATFNERLSNHMLVAVTETARRADIDRLIEGLKEATR